MVVTLRRDLSASVYECFNLRNQKTHGMRIKSFPNVLVVPEFRRQPVHPSVRVSSTRSQNAILRMMWFLISPARE